MSSAATHASQGYDFQKLIATHWIAQLLTDDRIESIQIESNGIPNDNTDITVDDIVIIYQDGTRRYIQAKKNQPNHKEWSLKDQTIKDELPKIRDQLSSGTNVTVELVSRSPFSDLSKLTSDCRLHPDLSHFEKNASRVCRKNLGALSNTWCKPPLISTTLN